MTYKDILVEASDKLKEVDITEAELDARILFEEAFGVNRGWLLAHFSEKVDITQESISLSYKKFLEYIERRSKRIPLQHILGYRDFMGMKFRVTPDVLIPRMDTEILVEEALLKLHDGMKILDMCTGSGCILISLLKYTNSCRGVGVDLSQSALEVAEENAKELLKGRGDISYCYVNSNMFSSEYFSENEDGPFDLIVSNPPYIKSDVIPMLDIEVREHDPMMALDGGSDGLKFYRILAKESPKYLASGGWIMLEIGYDEAKEVTELLSRNGFEDIETVKDLAGLDRVVKGRKPIKI